MGFKKLSSCQHTFPMELRPICRCYFMLQHVVKVGLGFIWMPNVLDLQRNLEAHFFWICRGIDHNLLPQEGQNNGKSENGSK